MQCVIRLVHLLTRWLLRHGALIMHLKIIGNSNFDSLLTCWQHVNNGSKLMHKPNGAVHTVIGMSKSSETRNCSPLLKSKHRTCKQNKLFEKLHSTLKHSLTRTDRPTPVHACVNIPAALTLESLQQYQREDVAIMKQIFGKIDENQYISPPLWIRSSVWGHPGVFIYHRQVVVTALINIVFANSTGISHIKQPWRTFDQAGTRFPLVCDVSWIYRST